MQSVFPNAVPGLEWRAPDLKERLKMLAGALLFPAATRRWQQQIASVPLLRSLADRVPRMRYQIYRPYLSDNLGIEARADVIAGHYRVLHDIGWGRVALASCQSSLLVACFEGKSGTPFDMRLSTALVNEREGEQALQLSCEGRVIYTASFTFGMEGAQRVLTIGSLQGLRAQDGEELMRLATRELHGMRPSNFMMAMLRDLAAALDCATVVLVSNRNRIVVNYRRRKRITFDYDALALELGGERGAGGNFRLEPRSVEGQDESEVRSSKRAAFRRRNALIADARNQILRAL
jgi:uncharacterized protein VirK/YbjX